MTQTPRRQESRRTPAMITTGGDTMSPRPATIAPSGAAAPSTHSGNPTCSSKQGQRRSRRVETTFLPGQRRLQGGQLRQGPPRIAVTLCRGDTSIFEGSGECIIDVLFVVQFMSFPLTTPICIKVQLETTIKIHRMNSSKPVSA